MSAPGIDVMDVKLMAEAAVRDAGVTVVFRLENRGLGAIVAYLHPDDGRRAALLPGAYLCASREAGELRLLLAPPPAPRHYSVSRGALPLARRIEPGEVYEGRLDFSLPMTEWTAYVPAVPSEGSPDIVVDHGVLQIGVFPASQAAWSEPGPEEGSYWTEGEGLELLVAPFTLPRPVPVLSRLDDTLRW